MFLLLFRKQEDEDVEVRKRGKKPPK